MKILLEIITPERLAFSREVDRISAPTPDGTIGILPRHVPLFTSLAEGEVKITDGNDQYFLAIGGGFMQVTKKKVSILVSRAFHADELNEAETRKAYDAAKDLIAKQVKGIEMSDAQAILRRSIMELKVLRHRRSGGRPPLPTS